MNRAVEIITREVLRTEKNLFILRMFLTSVGYVGITFWLNAVRQTVAAWLLWTLIAVQWFLFLTIFVVSFLRLRQCRIASWWLLIPLVLSRINDWEILTIPATIIVMLIISERNKHVSQDREHLIPANEDAGTEVEMMQKEVSRLRQELELLDDPETICSFGQMAFDGNGVEQDYVQAANWYKMAAEQGSARAQHNLALMYENGYGVTRNLREAAKWYRMAADQGNAGSQNNLAALYEIGEGVLQDEAIALALYRQAAKGGDENAVSNVKRFEALLKGPVGDRKQYEKMVFAFSDLMAEHSPLIGDCSLLPYPKGTLLYAIRWVMDEYETKRVTTDNEELRQAYDKMLPTLSYLFTRLARDWHEIDPADKGAIAKLHDCESFPEWAIKYKRKYIDDERASNEAAEVAVQVIKDRIAQEKSEV